MALRKRIGEILSDLGVASEVDVDSALKKQLEIFEEKSRPDRPNQSRLVTEARFSRKASSIPLLGQLLIDMGVVTEAQVEKALKQQDTMLQKYCSLEYDALCSVLDMVSRVNSSLNLLEVLSVIMKNVNKVTRSEASTLMLLEEMSGELVFSVPTGPEAEKLVDVRIKRGQGIAGWVAEHEKAVIVSDVGKDPRFFPGIDALSGFQTRSVLAVPMKAKDKLIGVLEAINKENGSAFSQEDAMLLTIFADQAALAIDNARLFSQLKDQIKQTSRMQDELARSEKFRALSQMAGGFAHDFRNILNAMMGFAEIALLEIENGQVRQDVEEILKAGHRAKDLVDQILAFTSLQHQESVPVNCTKVIKQSVKLFRASLPSTIEIRQNLSEEDISILADASQLHRVLMNLFDNAKDAIGDRPGVVGIETMPVFLDENGARTFSGFKPGNYLKIVISDNGCGMAPETMERIFEPYFTTKEKGMGTGMGLAIVRGIVTGHAGSISVRSEPEQGTTFEILFPRTTQALQARPKTFEQLPTGKEHVLVVDDEETLLVVLEKMLRHLGYRVTTSNRAEDALETFRADADRFDLVITDLAMPGIRGDKLSEKLMEIRPDVRVILWTAFDEDLDRHRFASMGIRECLKKPVIMADLAHTVRKVLDED